MLKVLDLQPSSMIDVFFNFANKSNKIQCRYVGCVKGAFLIVRYPSKMSEPGWSDAFVEGNVLSFRALANRETLEVIGFKSTILRNVNTQERVLFLSFPTEVETRKLRAEPRINVEMMSDLEFPQLGIDSKLCLIRDMSPSGCACEYNIEFPEGLSEEECEAVSADELKLDGENVKMCIDMKGYGDDKVYEIHGQIKNLQVKDKVFIGIKFDDDSRASAEAFYSYMMLEGVA